MNYDNSKNSIDQRMIRFSSRIYDCLLFFCLQMILFRKKETILQTRKKHEDLEFQLMELETRCEAELEQAEEHFQTEQILVTQSSQIRQVKSNYSFE